ncbi:MAG: GntR family transcriptional regulator [Bacteroides sp.]|nr:GntR family transcriptional regulator [Bacteroides sp.]
MKIDHSSIVPIHAQVEELLRKLIEKPPYCDGGYLPPEAELAKKLGISRNTVRQATNKLEYEGLIIRRKGKGTKAVQKTVTTQLSNWHSFTQEMNEKGIAFINYQIASNKVFINEKIARFFDLPDQSEVVKLIRLRGDKVGPFVYFESYFHPRTGITVDEDFSQPLYDILEKRYNILVSLSREEITARKVKPNIAALLNISKSDPVLIRERFVSDPGGRPVEYNIGYYQADKFTYTIEIQKRT